MSTQDAETDVVRATYDAASRGDLDGMLEHLDRLVEVYPGPETVDALVFGRKNIEEWWGRLFPLGARITLERTRKSRDDKVIAEGWIELAGVRSSFVALHRVRDGKILTMHHFFSNLEELSAVV